MIEKHYDYTPYAYVYNNPITLIDPLGLDTVLMTNSGNIGKTLPDKENDHDVLLIVRKKEAKTGEIKYDKDGNLRKRHKSLDIEKDMLSAKSENKLGTLINLGNKEGDVGGLFEFVVDNTNVEWSLQSKMISPGHTNTYLTTSHDGLTDKYGSYLTQLTKPNSLIYHMHSHPTDYQGSKTDVANVKPSKDDINFRNHIMKTQPNAQFFIYNKRYGVRNFNNDKIGIR